MKKEKNKNITIREKRTIKKYKRSKILKGLSIEYTMSTTNQIPPGGYSNTDADTVSKEKQETTEAAPTTEVGGIINLEIYPSRVSQAKCHQLEPYLENSLNILE